MLHQPLLAFVHSFYKPHLHWRSILLSNVGILLQWNCGGIAIPREELTPLQGIAPLKMGFRKGSHPLKRAHTPLAALTEGLTYLCAKMQDSNRNIFCRATSLTYIKINKNDIYFSIVPYTHNTPAPPVPCHIQGLSICVVHKKFHFML